MNHPIDHANPVRATRVLHPGVTVVWRRSPQSPVPEWADTCSLCKRSINSVSPRVSYVNSKLMGPSRTHQRSSIKLKHICRDCRNGLKPARNERRDRWKRIQNHTHGVPGNL